MVSVDVKTILGKKNKGVCVLGGGGGGQNTSTTTTKKEATLVHADAVPRTIEDRKLFKKNVDSHLKTHRNQHRRRR